MPDFSRLHMGRQTIHRWFDTQVWIGHVGAVAYNVNAEVIPATLQPHPARVEETTRTIRTNEGTEIETQVTVYLPADVPVGGDDVLQLADGRRPRIVRVRARPTLASPVYIEVLAV